MFRALYTAATGMYGQQLNVDTISNNIANVNTAGFKKSRVDFQDLLYQTIQKPTVNEDTGVNQPMGVSIGLGTKPAAIQTMFSMGNLTPTNNPLDVAINGEAFFKVTVPGYEDPQYTKNGAFSIDAEGNMVNSDGYKIVGVDTLDTASFDVKIDTDGTVSYMVPGQTEPITAGRIELSKFVNPAGLDKLGKNLYSATMNSGEAQDWDPQSDNTVSLQSGYLETSNVQIVEEMVNLIQAQRAYEFNSKVITSSDEMLQMAAGLKR
ncbi:MAG: flagellar basal-body rod protein FlgG [Acidobacteriota bacterium]